MKKEVIISAKSVDEAVALAVKELGAPSSDAIEYTVLEEAKKGFLGLGASDAKISATYSVGGETRALAFVEKLLADMNIELVSLTPEKEKGIIHVKVNVKNKDPLLAFMNRMKSKPGVSEVYRR